MVKKKYLTIVVMIAFIMTVVMPSFTYAQVQYNFITLADGTVVKMSKQQLQLLINQPGIVYSQGATLPNLVGEQMAIPLSQELGGGYIIGTPEAIATALNNTGIAMGATASSVLGATASAGAITTSGSLAGAAAIGGVTAGTVALTAGIAAAVIGGVIAVTADEDEGGFTVTHITTSHH